MQIRFSLFALLTGGVLSACAHQHQVEGIEVPSEIPAGVRVQIGSPEVKEGDRVRVVRLTCTRASTGELAGRGNRCRNTRLGEATVLKVLDHDSAVIRPEAGLQVEPGMAVESIGD